MSVPRIHSCSGETLDAGRVNQDIGRFSQAMAAFYKCGLAAEIAKTARGLNHVLFGANGHPGKRFGFGNVGRDQKCVRKKFLFQRRLPVWRDKPRAVLC